MKNQAIKRYNKVCCNAYFFYTKEKQKIKCGRFLCHFLCEISAIKCERACYSLFLRLYIFLPMGIGAVEKVYDFAFCDL